MDLHIHHHVHAGFQSHPFQAQLGVLQSHFFPNIFLKIIAFSIKTSFIRFSYKNLPKDIAQSISLRIYGAIFPSFFLFFTLCRCSQVGQGGMQLWRVKFRSIICREIQNNEFSINAKPLQRLIIKNQIFKMQSHLPIKNYYKILGVSENASLFEIESAYEKLAAKWHPDKHKEHRKSAETRFKEIAQAFEVLSDQNKRSHYDEILHKEYSLADAQSTFDRFFNEHGFVDEQEEKFFNTHFPDPRNNYYNILGVPKNASLEDIKNAYRKLSLKYHPKNNPNDEQAKKKFVEVNEAYNALSNEFRRENYDNIMFGAIQPVRAYSIFDDFFGSRFPSIMDEDFRPFFHNRWSRDLDRLMIDEGEEKNIKDGQTIKTSSVWSNKNGKESGKTITTRTTYKNGKANEERTEDYLFPSGERKVTKTIRAPDGKVETKEYKLKKGEELPKELTM